MVFTSLQKVIQFDPLVAAFRGCTHVVHETPLIASTRRICIEADVGLHGDGAGSAKLGGGTWGFTGASSIVVQRTAELCVLTAKVIAIGLHLQPGFTDRDAIRADGDSMEVRSFPGVAKVQIDVRGDMLTLTQRVHGHRVMRRVQKE